MVSILWANEAAEQRDREKTMKKKKNTYTHRIQTCISVSLREMWSCSSCWRASPSPLDALMSPLTLTAAGAGGTFSGFPSRAPWFAGCRPASAMLRLWQYCHCPPLRCQPTSLSASAQTKCPVNWGSNDYHATHCCLIVSLMVFLPKARNGSPYWSTSSMHL